MNKRVVISILIILLFVSCAPQQPEQDSELVVIEQNTDLIEPAKPECGPDDWGPRQFSVDSPVDTTLPVVFSWEIDCVPDEYYIDVYKHEDNSSSVFSGHFETGENEYTLSIPLEPASFYKWDLDGFTSNNINLANEKWLPIGNFKTGPLCTVEDLVPPTLVFPVDGSVDHGKDGYGGPSNEVHAIIKYPVGDCIPKYFEIEYSTNTNFIETKDLNPAGVGIGKMEGEWWVYGDDSSRTEDCNLYYWRARATAENGYGDWSETFTFYLDIYGNCYTFPELRGIQNANCRSDPWAGENYISIIRENDTAELLGLNEDASWGMFKLKNELECWVNMNLMEPIPDDAFFFPGFYPVLEHSEAPPQSQAPIEDPVPEPQQGCMMPSGRSGSLVCQIPCPDPQYAARVCP